MEQSDRGHGKRKSLSPRGFRPGDRRGDRPLGRAARHGAEGAAMTRIILVRHGHVEWLAPERFRGRAELPLSSLGRRQAQAAAGYIAATWKPEAVYTSPLGRCRETGAAIAAPFRLEPQPIDGLADIDYGEWQGLTPDQAKECWPNESELWFRAPHIAALPAARP